MGRHHSLSLSPAPPTDRNRAKSKKSHKTRKSKDRSRSPHHKQMGATNEKVERESKRRKERQVSNKEKSKKKDKSEADPKDKVREVNKEKISEDDETRAPDLIDGSEDELQKMKAMLQKQLEIEDELERKESAKRKVAVLSDSEEGGKRIRSEKLKDYSESKDLKYASKHHKKHKHHGKSPSKSLSRHDRNIESPRIESLNSPSLSSKEQTNELLSTKPGSERNRSPDKLTLRDERDGYSSYQSSSRQEDTASGSKRRERERRSSGESRGYRDKENFNYSEQRSKQTKTSDTYWNKYADKLGITIKDPVKDVKEPKNISDNNRRKISRKEFKKDSPPKETKSSDLEKSNKQSDYRKNEGESTLKKSVMDPLATKTGGAYIPPAKLKMMQDQITDKSSAAFQRLAWEALKKSINGLVNKVNVSNIGIIVRELFRENIVRGRGILCRALMQAQAFSPTFTHVYGAMVAVINTKFPQIGELLLHRLVIQFRKGVRRNDKTACMASCRFIAHLINQQVAHEVVALEILTMLLERAKDITDDSEIGDKSRKASVELAIAFLKECGMKLTELSPKGLMFVTETLRNVLHEGKLDSRYQYMIEVLMAIKKGGFKDFPAVIEELDLVEEEDQFTHIVELDGKLESHDILNVFKHDPNYEESEQKYKELKESILGESDDEDDGESGDEESGGSDSDDEASEDDGEKRDQDGNIILDKTETNLVAFRRIVYLTIQSSINVDECAHKLLKGEIKPGWEEELCNMIIDCCAQQRTYMKFYGLLAQRFCLLNKSYQAHFESIFKDAYETCHRLEIEKLRNVSKLFSHLFFTDAISWEAMSCIHLNQDETTSSSRVFLKIVFEVSTNFKFLLVVLSFIFIRSIRLLKF